ncbi:MAG: hypothetical protein R6V67_05020 [Spirochaetia bacterium]
MKIHTIETRIEEKTLKVVATLKDSDGVQTEAYLPARETAALLPREIFVGKGESGSSSLFPLMKELLEKLTLGREVRVWMYEDRLYCSFPRWRKSDISAALDTDI